MEHQLEMMDDQTAKRTLKMWNDSNWNGGRGNEDYGQTDDNN